MKKPSINVNRIVSLLASMTLFSVTYLSHAQNAEVVSKPQTKEEVERIIITAQGGDAAMQAFNSGNFALAEIKFKENEKCAFRQERNRDAFIQAVQNSQLNQELSGNASNSSSSITDSNASRVDGNYGHSTTAKKSPNDREATQEYTCDNRAFQIYMTGMSQLQLGRTSEAEQNFKRAVALSQNQYDAHHRLALMSLLRKDTEGAREHLSKIKSMLRRCLTCDARDEILTRVDFIQKALDGKVRLQ